MESVRARAGSAILCSGEQHSICDAIARWQDAEGTGVRKQCSGESATSATELFSSAAACFARWRLMLLQHAGSCDRGVAGSGESTLGGGTAARAAARTARGIILASRGLP